MTEEIERNRFNPGFPKQGPSSHSSVGSVADLRTGHRWFDSRLSQYSFRELMTVTAVRCFDNGYVGKQPVAWKEYCAEYWFKGLQESMAMCTGRRDKNEIMLKTVLNTIRSISPEQRFYVSAIQIFRKEKKKTAGKGEVARYEQFLLFPEYFLPFW